MMIALAFSVLAAPSSAIAASVTTPPAAPAVSTPAPGSEANFKGKTMATVSQGKKVAWLHQEPDPAKWQIHCQLVYQIRSRIPKRVCATVGEWEAIAGTAAVGMRDAKRGARGKSGNMGW